MNQVIERPIVINRPSALSMAATRGLNQNKIAFIVGFLVVHALLGLAMQQSPAVATVHAWLTLTVGLYFALSSVRLERVAYTGAYIIGAEVLWRMTHAGAFWEFGKYALSAVFLAALLRGGLFRGPILGFVYFALLLPSLVLPLVNLSTSELRDQISFNLSGPFALMTSVWFFSHVRMTLGQLRWLFISLIGPIFSITAISLFSTLSASKLIFSTESNFSTSGGFGPNQVSSVLGLGAMMAALYLMLKGPKKFSERGVIVGCLLLFSIQSALTLSRGGLYCAAGGLFCATFYLIRDPRTRTRLVLAGATAFLLINFVIIPQLGSFTGGALIKRFEDTGLTGRDKIIMSDLQTWSEHPVFGVGPGQSKANHRKFFRYAAAHTEFSRLVAEHGIFGLGAMVAMAMLLIIHLRHAKTREGKALALAMTAWSLLYMITAAMRIAAPSFAFGLAALTLLTPESEELTTEDQNRLPEPDGFSQHANSIYR